MDIEEDILKDIDSSDKDIYDDTFREELTENDELTPAEEGFMNGYSRSFKND